MTEYELDIPAQELAEFGKGRNAGNAVPGANDIDISFAPVARWTADNRLPGSRREAEFHQRDRGLRLGSEVERYAPGGLHARELPFDLPAKGLALRLGCPGGVPLRPPRIEEGSRHVSQGLCELTLPVDASTQIDRTGHENAGTLQRERKLCWRTDEAHLRGLYGLAFGGCHAVAVAVSPKK